jgi:AbrB family looped-hinge helix DNA binding protein
MRQVKHRRANPILMGNSSPRRYPACSAASRLPNLNAVGGATSCRSSCILTATGGPQLLPFDNGIMPSYNGIMNTTVTIDKAGRVVIPKEIRDELRLGPGDSLALESEGERLTLRPVHTNPPLQKERGVWVFHGGQPLSLDDANQIVRDTREQRDRQNRGEPGR